MTYKQLLEQLKQLTTDELENDASIYIKQIDEVLPIQKFVLFWEENEESENVDGILDDDHPFLVV